MPMIQKTILEKSSVVEGMLEKTKGGQHKDHVTEKSRFEKRSGESHARLGGPTAPAYSGMPVPPLDTNKGKRRNVFVEGIHPKPGKPMVEDTLIRTKEPGPRAVHLEGMIVKTTGENPRLPVNGIITQTTRGANRIQDSVMKYHGEKIKTQPMDYGQVPYAGRLY